MKVIHIFLSKVFRFTTHRRGANERPGKATRLVAKDFSGHSGRFPEMRGVPKACQEASSSDMTSLGVADGGVRPHTHRFRGTVYETHVSRDCRRLLKMARGNTDGTFDVDEGDSCATQIVFPVRLSKTAGIG